MADTDASASASASAMDAGRLPSQLDSAGTAYLSTGTLASYRELHALLTLTSQGLARSEGFRHALSRTDDGVPSLLRLIHALYALFGRSDVAKSVEEREREHQALERERERERESEPRHQHIQLLLLSLRCLRNAMAGCPESQHAVHAHWGTLTPLLDHITAFAALTDTTVIPLARTAAQFLSNLVTANAQVQHAAWPALAPLCLRLLASPDTQTQTATQILLINVLKPSPARSAQLCSGTGSPECGTQILEALLSLADSVVLQSESSDEPGPEKEIEHLDESLGLIYTIFTHLFESGLASSILAALAPKDEIQGLGQITTNAQITLLKLLDSWLHYAQKNSSSSSSATDTAAAPMPPLAGLEGLASTFKTYAAFTRNAMQRGLEHKDDQDKRLIGVHHALLLLLQCMLSIGLAAEGRAVLAQGVPSSAPHHLLHAFRNDTDLVDQLVALLHQTNAFAPPISPFKPSASSPAPAPDGHVLSSTGAAASTPTRGYGFDHLKRDVVRVLGVLVFSPSPAPDADVRAVQDRVRDKGGLFDVLNMTVLDERNPYMREHAIFTLRYLLAGNLESQELIRKLQPVADQQGGVPVPV